LLRNFERLSNSWNNEVKSLGRYIKNTANELFTLRRALSKSEIDVLGFTERAKSLRKHLQHYLAKMSTILEAKGT
jgi:transposase